MSNSSCVIDGLEFVVVVMGRNNRLFYDETRQMYFEVRDYKQSFFNSEDENGRYYRYYIRQKDDKRFEEIPTTSLDPYCLELKEISSCLPT